jgi:hypothetical protein
MPMRRPARAWWRVRPNSDAALTVFTASAPAFASAMILAFEAWACMRNEEKSLFESGCRTAPSTLPPLAFTMSLASFSSACPKA